MAPTPMLIPALAICAVLTALVILYALVDMKRHSRRAEHD